MEVFIIVTVALGAGLLLANAVLTALKPILTAVGGGV